MLTSISVILFYGLLCLLIIYLIRRKEFNLTRKEIFLTFGFKVLMGCLYGFIFLHYYNGDDTWAIHLESLKEWELLQSNPLQFFREYTPETAIRNAKVSGNFISLYLADLEYCLLIKTLGIFNIISRGNYYVNVVFFNFFVFWGHFWLYQTLVSQFPHKRKLFLIVVFFLPTSLFWLSGIRGDGLLFFFFSLTIFSFYRYFRNGQISYLLTSLAGIFGVVIFRSGVAILLIPGLISWWLVIRHNKKIALAFASVYGIFLLLFFATTLLPGYNAPALVSEKQAEFLKLNGNTKFALNVLDPSIFGFVKVLPQAFLNTFLRPYIWEAKGPLQLVASVGTLFLWMAATIALILRTNSRSDITGNHSLFATLLVFAIFNYLLIGLTVPFPGAIVRYKSVAEICFFTCCALLTDPGQVALKKNRIYRLFV